MDLMCFKNVAIFKQSVFGYSIENFINLFHFSVRFHLPNQVSTSENDLLTSNVYLPLASGLVLRETLQFPKQTELFKGLTMSLELFASLQPEISLFDLTGALVSKKVGTVG